MKLHVLPPWINILISVIGIIAAILVLWSR